MEFTGYSIILEIKKLNQNRILRRATRRKREKEKKRIPIY